MKLYFFHISLYNLAHIAPVFTGFTVALLLAFLKRGSRPVNLFLSSALIVSVLMIAGLTPVLPALGPLLYFYVQQQISPNRQHRWKDVLHFSPLLAAYCLPAWMPLMLVIVYLYMSHRLIQGFYHRLRPVLMDRPRLAFRSLETALLLLGLLCALSIINDSFLFGVAFILMGLAAQELLKPDNDVQLAIPVTDRGNAREKGRRLKEAVAVNHLYEDAELTLTSLALKLGMHPHELSRIINFGLEKNFSDFINEFRVREVVRKMRNPAFDRLTLLGIAYESGFNSKRTFNRVFKEITGKTPVEYKNVLRKEVPFDELAPLPRMQLVILRSESAPNWGAENLKRNKMFKTYLKIAYRQMRKQRLYAAIKIGGFALGIAACLLIGLYIREETNFDRSYPDADRIYRLVGDGEFDTGVEWPAPTARAIHNDFPEIAYSGRAKPVQAMEIRRTDQVQNSYEQGFMYADQQLLDALQLPMVSGNGNTALKEPLTMVISKTMADKYYHGQNPVGQAMYLDDDRTHPYRIGAVMADIPATSHLHQFNFILTLSEKEFWGGEQANWGAYNYWVYVKLKAGTDVAAFDKKLNADLAKNYILPQYLRQGLKDAEQVIKKVHFGLQPVKDINLYSYNMPDGFTHGDIRFIWLFGAIALFILIIAGINFINLSTAKSANRAKEVGLRKVIGSHRSSLIYQFLTESMVYSLVSFIIGLLIAWLALPYFNMLAAKSLVIPWGEWWLAPCILGAAVIVGTLAGLYPAVYLSAFRPVQVLKGTLAKGSKSPLLRNGLVVFQFATSVILIIGTIVIYDQMHFILNRKVGFDKDQVMVLQGTNTLSYQNIQNLKADLAKIASVKSASVSDYLPVNGTNRNGNNFFREGREKLDPGVWGQYWQVDDTYRKTLGIKLLEGRDFSPNMTIGTSGKSVIINQNMVAKLRLKNPLGTRLSNNHAVFTVIGVVEDFNFASMRGEIAPMMLHFGFSPSMMTVKLRGGNVQNAIANVSALWKKYSPNQPIRYTFLDQEFTDMYADVERTGSIFTSFAVLAIIIACLGLFALSAFMAEQRSKEIGIRKVLGASVQSVTRLLSADFIKLVLLAIVIASPIAWWAMHAWLQDFAYQISISWWIFAAAGLIAMMIALITVSFQSIKAALANPVRSLRSE